MGEQLSSQQRARRARTARMIPGYAPTNFLQRFVQRAPQTAAVPPRASRQNGVNALRGRMPEQPRR